MNECPFCGHDWHSLDCRHETVTYGIWLPRQVRSCDCLSSTQESP